MARPHRVLLLSGAVLPAGPAYAALLGMLGERVDAVAKDLEVYAGDQPPPDFGLAVESEGILREADLTASTVSISSAIRAAAPRRSPSRPSTRAVAEPGAPRTGLGG